MSSGLPTLPVCLCRADRGLYGLDCVVWVPLALASVEVKKRSSTVAWEGAAMACAVSGRGADGPGRAVHAPALGVCVCVVGGVVDDVECLCGGASGSWCVSGTSMVGLVDAQRPRDG